MTHANHLTDEQLSALLDDALAAPERAACEAHLASCEACRASFAERSALEGALSTALSHDPGEAYFASFAERVGRRIVADAAVKTPAPRRSPWAWLLSPRGLSLAGATAALLITAGVAWMRFQQQDDAASALRAASPSPVGAKLREPSQPPATASAPMADRAVSEAEQGRLDAREESVVPPTPASVPPARDERSLAPRADAGSRRARQVKTLANGEQVPVPRATDAAKVVAPGSGADAEAAKADALSNKEGSALAKMKQRAIQPAGDAPAERPAERSAPGALRGFAAPPPERSTSSPTPALLPQATAPEKDVSARNEAPKRTESLDAMTRFRVGGTSESKSELRDATPLAVQCGKVTDTRGTPLRGAQLTLLGASTRTSRSAPDGSFCLPQAVAGDTLILMHVGFEPLRLVLTASTPLAFGLEPIGTLGPRDGILLGARPEAGPRALGRSLAEPFDPYAAEPESVRVTVAAARERSKRADSTRTVQAYESAAESWNQLGASLRGKPAWDARYQHLVMLREAYRVAATPARGERLRAGLAAFAAAAPRDLPERARVIRWQTELDGAPDR